MKKGFIIIKESSSFIDEMVYHFGTEQLVVQIGDKGYVYEQVPIVTIGILLTPGTSVGHVYNTEIKQRFNEQKFEVTHQWKFEKK